MPSQTRTRSTAITAIGRKFEIRATITAATATRKPRAPAPVPSAPARTRDQVADHDAGGDGAEQAEAGPQRPVDQEPRDQADHGGKQGHPAAGRPVGAGGAGEHPDRDADAEVGEKVHMRKPNRPGTSASIRHTLKG